MTLPGRTKRIVFGLMTAFLVLGSLELASFVALAIFDRINQLEEVGFPSDRAAYDEVLRTGITRYDRDLGWDERPIIRRPQGIIKGRRYFASAYGDSFTWGAEVHEDLVWTHRFKVLSGREMLNMGVNASGTDQAYLKLIKYYPSYPTRHVILALIPENISRLVSVVRRFYFRRDPFPYIKPRFEVAESGGVELLKNPIASESQLYRLGDKAFLQSLAVHDFWYRFHYERYGFDLINGRQFPALYDLYLMVRGLVRYGWNPVGYKYFFDTRDSEPYRILLHIVRELKIRSDELGFEPLVLIHAEQPNIQDHQFLEPFVRFLRDEIGIEVLNMPQVFHREIRSGRTSARELYGESHLSPQGNELVARELVRFFQKRGALR